MKFTKEQLLDTLKEKLTENGKHLSVSEKTIKSLSDTHYDLLTNEETELNDLVGKILPLYVSLNGNYEKDNADFIKKWKEEHPDNTPNNKKDDTPDNSSKRLEALIEEVKALKAKNDENEKIKLISSKRSELLKMFKEKGIKDDKWTEKYMNKLSLTENTDIEKETEDALDFYNLSHSKGGNKTPGNPDGNTDNSPISAKRWEGVNKVLNR